MSVDAAPSDLTKVDSAISGLSSSPPDDKAPVKGHRRASSSAAGVYNITDLGKSTKRSCSWNSSNQRTADKWIEKEGKELQIAKETQKLNW